MREERVTHGGAAWPPVVIGVVLTVLVLGLWNQPLYPATWLDEGFVVQGAMNLVRYGKYAMKSTEGFRVLDQPLIANGPGVVLPIGLAFALFGIGLLQARIVMVVYMVLSAAVFLAVARRLFGWLAAVTSAFFLLALPAEGFLFLGRQALGDVPALAYFLIGYLLWLTWLEDGGHLHGIGAGLLWGAAMVTKNQYALLIPTLLLFVAVDRLYYHRHNVGKVALVLSVAVAVLGVWYAVQLVLVGFERFAGHLASIQQSARVTVFALRPTRIPGSLSYLVRSGILPVLAPGLAYAGWRCRSQSRDCGRELLLALFVLVWLTWYAFASVGWHRYAFAPYALGSVLTGKVIADVFVRLQAIVSLKKPGQALAPRWLAVLLLTCLIAGLALGVWVQARRVAAAPDTSAQEFAGYLRENVQPEAIVESWEWEIDALASLCYHHPTNDWVDIKTAVLQFGDDEPATAYDFSEHRPDYLIDGPFSKWTGLYNRHLAAGCCELLHSIGPYDLYQVQRAPDD